MSWEDFDSSGQKEISQNLVFHYCSICGRDFLEKPTLLNHMKVKHFECKKSHKCRLCSYTFKRKKDLNVHILFFHKCEYCGNLLICFNYETCDFSSSDMQDLVGQKASKHKRKRELESKSEIISACSYCHVDFTNIQQQRVHILFHKSPEFFQHQALICLILE